MAGPADQAAANVQAMNETLAAYAHAAAVPNPQAITLAAAAVTADDWTGGSYDDFVYDPQDAGTWTATFAGNTASNAVFNARSGPMKDPYGGGFAGNQFT